MTGIASNTNPDITAQSVLDKKCSYAQFLEDKLYEYLAVIRMVQELATDTDILKQLIAEFDKTWFGHWQSSARYARMAKYEESMRNSAAAAAKGSLLGWFAKQNLRFEGWLEGIDYFADETFEDLMWRGELDHKERAYFYNKRSEMNADLAWDKLKAFITGLWEVIQTRWRECGVLYAVTTTSVDALFVISELALGQGLATAAKSMLEVFKSLQFAVHMSDKVSLLTQGTRNALAAGVQAARETVYEVTLMAGTAVTGIGRYTRVYTKSELEAAFPEARHNSHSGVKNTDHNNDLFAKGPAHGDKKTRSTKIDYFADGSYRDVSDPPGVRTAASGEKMVAGRDQEYVTVTSFERRDNVYRGRFGEAMADQYASEKGWIKLDGPPTTAEYGQGFKGPWQLDGLYQNPVPPPPYIISEVKYGNSKLGGPYGGPPPKDEYKQMDPQWIEERLCRMFGENRMREIRSAGYDRIILRIDKNGHVIKEHLGTELPYRHEGN